MHVSIGYPASGERQHRPEPVLVQNPGHVDDDIQSSALDERVVTSRKCWIEKKMPENCEEMN